MQNIKAIRSLKQKRVSSAVIRPADVTAYASGDVLSAVTTDAHMEFIVSEGGKYTGTILSLIANTSASVATKPDLELWLFHTDIAEVADNLAFAPTDAEMLTLVGVVDIPVANWKVGTVTAGAAGNSAQVVAGINLPYVTTPATRSGSTNTGTLYGQLVHRAAYTPVSGEVFTVDLVVAQD